MPSILPRMVAGGAVSLSLLLSGSPRSDVPDSAGLLAGETGHGAVRSSGLPGTTWPETAAGAFSLRAPRSSLALAVRLAHALPSPGRWLDDLLRFDNPLPHASSLSLRPRPDGLEDHLAFDHAPDAEQVDYLLDVRRVAGLRQVGRVVEFLDAGGTPRLRMEAPYIVGADGRVAQADVELGCAHDESTAPPWGRAVVAPGADECRLTVSWAGHGVAYPAVLDPAWTLTANPSDARDSGSATMLPGGLALVAGGRSCSGSSCVDLLTSELFDPETGTWASGAPLHGAHTNVRMIAVDKQGGVALVGGDGNVAQTTALTGAEFYAYDTHTWETLPPVPTGRYYHDAVVSPDGTRLHVFGGLHSDKEAALSTVETLDFTTKTWASKPGAMLGPRTFLSATPVGGDKVLLAGGAVSSQVKVPLATAELYDLAKGTSESLPAMPTARVTQTAHRVTIGGKAKVMLVGGATFACDLYDIESRTWSPFKPMKTLRALHAGIDLSDGSVLAIGGLSISLTGQPTVERFDPVAQTWKAAQPIHENRAVMAATRLAGDRVLVVGGTSSFFLLSPSFATAELFTPIEAGQPCTSAGDCRSMQCADGVCCDRACDGECEACVKAKTGSPDGTCVAIAPGVDPDDECASEEVSSCGRTGTCDGDGHCARYAAGTLCGAATCASDVGSVLRCDGLGSCLPSVTTCAPYRCQDPTSCGTDCDSDDQCTADGYCEDKACHADLAQGATCTRGAQCPGGQCVDGVCCESACGGCQACAQALKQDGSPDGTCGAAREGLDPHEFCKESPVSTCDQNGLCDGQGKCALHAEGTLCESAVCVSNASGGRTSERRECNGQGACLPRERDCGQFACVVGSCLSSCQSDADCLGTSYCEQGQCLPRKAAGNDQACGSNHECLSGFCVDGYCCNQACQGQCEACDVEGAHGSCVAVAGPAHGARDACPGGSDDQPCQAHTCDGSLRSSCRAFVGADVTCRPATCAAGIETRAAVCDGQGRCADSTTVHCEPFLCQDNQCGSNCTSSDDCAPQFRCDLEHTTDTGGHDCVPRTVPECSDDGLSIIKTDGKRESCSPYLCKAGQCQQTCESVLDCVLPNVCDAASRSCLPARPNPDDGGCAVGPRPAGSSPPAWLAAVAAVVGLWRRRRQLGALASTALGLLAGCSAGPAGGPDTSGGSSTTDARPAARPALAVRTTLPRIASDPVRLETDAASVGFRLTAALPSSGATALPTGADFAGALGPGTTMHLRHHERGVEDSVSFAHRPGREQVDYTLDVRRVAGLRRVDRTVEFLDAGGTPRLRMEAPYIVGADGRVAQADVELGCAHDTSPLPPWGRAVVGPGVEECRLTVSWAGRGVTYPAVLDPSWVTTGSMPGDGRRDFAMGQLASGLVISAGGIGCSGGDCPISLGSEYFDPETGTWSPASNLKLLQFKSACTSLPGGGFFVAGSDVGGSTGSGNTEIFNEKTGAWEVMPALAVARYGATATLVLGGKAVAVIGGTATKKSTTAITKIELFDLKTRTWSPGGELKIGKFSHSATLLPNGKVLVAGGIPCGDCALDSVTAELYDPVARSSTPLPAMPGPHGGHAAALVTINQKPMVVLTGGSTTRSDLFDPAQNTWTVGPTMNAIRTYGAGALLGADKSFLVIGGIELPLTPNVSAERFDPKSMRWLLAGETSSALIVGSAVTLDDGRVLVAGGVADYKTGNYTTPRAQIFRPLDQGQPCKGSGECVSGSCADGVCCESACSGTCEACAQAKTGSPDGTCVAIAPGADPDSECPNDGAGSCGRTGTCDGQRQCALYASGAACGPTVCLNGVVNTSTCDGAGKCQAHGDLCGLFVCKDASSCATSCQDDQPCATEAHCDGGVCVPDLAPGATCTRGAQCPGGQCVDGVCCESACGGCQACAQALKQDGSPDGTCGDVREGLDPHDACDEAPVASCDRNGLCDGQGQCARHAAGTPCQDSACISNAEATRSESYACDGQGTCQTSPVDCGAFACLDGACLTSCQADTDCLLGSRCQGGACVAQLSQGSTCTQASDCVSGHCVDGFCCDKACDGTCEACAEPDAEGSCIPVFGSPRQGHGSCPGAPEGRPCEARTCDGSVSAATCEGWAGSSVTCGAPSCTDGVATLATRCDGQGHCPDAETVRCEPFVCEGAQCGKGCLGDDDCGDKFRCDRSRPGPNGAHACVARTGAFCDADGHTLVKADGSRQECAPYACDGAECRHDCRAVNDCVLPKVCDDASKQCVDMPDNPSDPACTAASPGLPTGAPPALGLLAIAAIAGRRRPRH